MTAGNGKAAKDFETFISAIRAGGDQWLAALSSGHLPENAAALHKSWANAVRPDDSGRAAWYAQLEKRWAEIAQDAPASATDKRFQSAAWQDNIAFRALADSYLQTCRVLLASVEDLALPAAEKKRAHFFLKQYLDAVAPSNFLMSNPEALGLAAETRGESLRQGVMMFNQDVARGRVSITDESAFEVGCNVAISPGCVVFENDLFQLIQYAPSTPEVFLRPILLVPPCINKYYILDLTPDNSLVRYLVSQGHTVFLMSWRNVDASLGHLTWDHYVADGVVKAIDTVRLITNVERINALGFCVGGTLLATALAVLRRLGHDVIESVTFLTTFIDFSDVGDIAAYIDDAFMAKREREVGQGGVVNGAELALAFSSLRANELVWSYVVNKYLKGIKPPAFDLLFWNADSTNLPGPWYCWYVRNTYIQNNLIHPDRVSVCGVPVDMSFVDMPAFVFAAREDHIVPWRSAYRSAACLGGAVDFNLGASGHIAGVVNPAAKNKRSYWSSGADDLDRDAPPDKWLQQATEHPGSWWTRWSDWLARHGGRRIQVRGALGSNHYPPLEPAPGRYVKVRSGAG
jgi:polyhydroxyalkanoate synthase